MDPPHAHCFGWEATTHNLWLPCQVKSLFFLKMFDISISSDLGSLVAFMVGAVIEKKWEIVLIFMVPNLLLVLSSWNLEI